MFSYDFLKETRFQFVFGSPKYFMYVVDSCPLCPVQFNEIEADCVVLVTFSALPSICTPFQPPFYSLFDVVASMFFPSFITPF